MKFRSALITVLLVCAASFPALAQYQWGRPRTPQSGACFYRDSGFRGDYFCLRDGERWPSMPPGFRDTISSIRVFGGARLRIFNDNNFNGISALIDRDVFDLNAFRLPQDPGRSWNDRISSIAVFRDHDDWERRDHDRGPAPYPNQPFYPNQPPYQGPPSRQGPPNVGACFYMDAGFRGASFCMNAGDRMPDLPPGFNDTISSIRIFGGARVRVFLDGNFQNASLVLDRDVINLQGIPVEGYPYRNWNDCISSIAVSRDHDNWDQRGNQGRPRY